MHLLDAYTENGTVPLLTAAEADALFSGAYAQIESTFEFWMTKNTPYTLQQLPADAQAALLDYAFRSGDGWLSGAGISADEQQVANYLINGQWQQLANYWKQQDTRRSLSESSLMNSDISTKKDMPPTGAVC